MSEEGKPKTIVEPKTEKERILLEFKHWLDKIDEPNLSRLVFRYHKRTPDNQVERWIVDKQLRQSKTVIQKGREHRKTIPSLTREFEGDTKTNPTVREEVNKLIKQHGLVRDNYTGGLTLDDIPTKRKKEVKE